MMTTKPIPELRAALQRFVDKHFDNAGKERPRISIPANSERDDDLVLSSALDELETLRAQSAQYRLLLVETLQQCSEVMPWVLREELRSALRAAEKAPETTEKEDMTEKPDPTRWGVWCTPIHEKTTQWPEHWWGQFWSTTDRVPLGDAREYDESGARAEAETQTCIDQDHAYRYEARPILTTAPETTEPAPPPARSEPCVCGKRMLQWWYASVTDAGNMGTDSIRHSRESCLTATERRKARLDATPPAGDGLTVETATKAPTIRRHNGWEIRNADGLYWDNQPKAWAPVGTRWHGFTRRHMRRLSRKLGGTLVQLTLVRRTKTGRSAVWCSECRERLRAAAEKAGGR